MLDEPMNPVERYLYGINIKLDAIVDMLSSLIEVYANQNDITIEEVKVKETIVKPKRTRKAH